MKPAAGFGAKALGAVEAIFRWVAYITLPFGVGAVVVGIIISTWSSYIFAICSSGSPVVDSRGYVRAVNFAKLGNTQSFNFGIPETQIRKFLQQ